MWLYKVMCVFIWAYASVKAENYYESESTTWEDIPCKLGEPQLQYHNGHFEVNETLSISDEVWIGYLYTKVPFLLLGCASLQSEKGVAVNEIGDCFSICGGGKFGIKRTSQESGLLCSCVMATLDTNEPSCKGDGQSSVCNNCFEIYKQINVSASHASGSGNTPEGDCLTYFYPEFKWQQCTRSDPIRSMCSNATCTDLKATAIQENGYKNDWSAGNKVCLTNGRHPSCERSIANTGFGAPQEQYHWTGIFRTNILIPLSLEDHFPRFSTDGYVYVTRNSTILEVTYIDNKKMALCLAGTKSTSTHPETSKYATKITPSITPSTYSEISVSNTKVNTLDFTTERTKKHTETTKYTTEVIHLATTTASSESSMSTTQTYATLSTDYASPTSYDGRIGEGEHTKSEKSPAVGVGIGVSVGIVVLVGGAVVIVVLNRRGILHCNRKTGDNKYSGNETAFKENMTYGKNNEVNVANHTYFILEKCEQSISNNDEHYNESNEANMEDNYNTIHDTEEPYEHEQVENCDYDHTINDLTSGYDAQKPENVYNKLKIGRPRDNDHVQKHGPNVVHISEDDYDTTLAVVTHGNDDVSDYNHIPHSAYKAGATGDDSKGDKGGDYDALNGMKYKVARPDESDYAHVNKDRIK